MKEKNETISNKQNDAMLRGHADSNPKQWQVFFRISLHAFF
jgi:hypothetical protein